MKICCTVPIAIKIFTCSLVELCFGTVNKNNLSVLCENFMRGIWTSYHKVHMFVMARQYGIVQ